MQGVSRESASAAAQRLEALLGTSGADPDVIGEELFAVTTLLAGNAGVRRALTDPSRDGAAKADLLQRLVGGRVSSGTSDLLAGTVRDRWSDARDLTDTVESLAVTALLASAERAGRLDDVEDELFRFSRTVSGDAALRDAFSARTSGSERKVELVRRLLGGRAAPQTVRLAEQAAAHPRGLRTERVLESFVQAAADRRSQLVAEVTAAVPLDQAQRERLASSLQRLFGRQVRLNVDLDPEVVGGIRVYVGGQLIDGTVASRLAEARRRLAG